MIEVDSLTYTYPHRTDPALEGIELNIPAGQFCGIVGPNGAGKSTLCYALSGFIPHFYRGQYKGRVVVEGRELSSTPLGELAGEVGLVFQNPFNQITGARYTVREEVAFGLENLGVPRPEMAKRVEEVLSRMGLGGLADRSPYALSGGQQQRLAIASILVMRPKVIVLDEPTSQLDPVGTQEVFSALEELVRERDTTVILAGQKLEWLARFADRVLFLDGGRLVADGPPREVLAAPWIEDRGVQPTRYTVAARKAQEGRLSAADQALPVTFEQAVEFFLWTFRSRT